jgi:uncharacterized protein YaaN involved in tellurite resistance
LAACLLGDAQRILEGCDQRGVFDIEAVKQANAALVATLEDSLRIAEEARGQRAAATRELAKLEGDIRRTLSSVKASQPRGGG